MTAGIAGIIRRIAISVFILLCLVGGPPPSFAGTDSEICIPAGPEIKVDGTVQPRDWKSSARVPIQVAQGWKATVWMQHDALNLYFAFRGLRRSKQRMFPEVLIDPALTRSSDWQPGEWWFHVSYNLCEGNGEHDVYRRNGVFMCSHTKPGWEGNNPPQDTTDDVEIRISFQKLGVNYRPDTKIGLALEVTNASGDATQIWRFWPAEAALQRPSTWAVAVLE